MIWLYFPPPAYAAEVLEVASASLGAVGEVVGGGTITRIQSHPEFERYWVTDPDGAVLPVEVVAADGVHRGICPPGAWEVFPRRELVTRPTRVDPAPFCERLATRPPALVPIGASGTGADSVSEGPRVRDAPLPGSRLWMGLVLAAGTVGLVATALHARGRAHLALLLPVLGALLGALVAGPPGIFNGAGAGWEKLLEANTLAHSPYGVGYATVMAPLVAVLGPGLDAVFATNLVLHLASAAALWALVRGETDVRTATLAGLAWALLPIPARLAASEAMHVAVTFFVVSALACAGAWRRGNPYGGWSAALLTGMAVHTRPEALALAPVVLLWAWPRRGVLPALLLALLVGARLAVQSTGQGVFRMEEVLSPMTLGRMLLPHLEAEPNGHLQAFWTRILTPLTLWPLALWGLWRAERGLRLRLFAWVVLLGLPMAIKSWPLADAMRLQAPVLPAWAVFVGVGLASLGRVAPLLLVVAALTRPTLPRWAQAREGDFLREVVPTLGDVTVRYDTTPHRSEKFGQMMEQLGPARWSGEEGTLYYRGLSCFLEGSGPNCDVQGCPVQVVHLPPDSDLDITLPPEGIDIGFWAACGASGSAAP